MTADAPQIDVPAAINCASLASTPSSFPIQMVKAKVAGRHGAPAGGQRAADGRPRQDRVQDEAGQNSDGAPAEPGSGGGGGAGTVIARPRQFGVRDKGHGLAPSVSNPISRSSIHQSNR